MRQSCMHTCMSQVRGCGKEMAGLWWPSPVFLMCRGPALRCAGFGVQAFYTGEGALGSLAKFANNFSPELAEKISEF